MFTGIIEEIGYVKQIEGYRLGVRADKTLEGLRLGDSVSLNGACLTITHLERDAFWVEVTPETLRRTNLGSLRPGDPVNLERALALGDRMGGHLVQGHVEATGQVVSVTPEGNAHVMRLRAPLELMRYIAHKGFVAVDGISLTVVEVAGDTFSVSVIPFTRECTVLGFRKPGDMVNLETDIIAKYAERLLHGEGTAELPRQGS